MCTPTGCVHDVLIWRSSDLFFSFFVAFFFNDTATTEIYTLSLHDALPISLSKALTDKDGQIQEAYSISAGLDYPGVGPEHVYLNRIGRADYQAITDKEALNAFKYLSQTEGIIPALESAHAVALAIKYAKKCKKSDIVVINISGRGDKDMDSVAKYLWNQSS